MTLFDADGPFAHRLSRVADIFLLNILWVICSLLVFTVGAATIALYYGMMKIHNNEDDGTVAMFFRSFKRNFKQGCCLTLIFLGTALFIWVDIQLCQSLNDILRMPVTLVLALLMVECGAIFSYAFPLVARFDNTIMTTLKNARALSFRHPIKTLLLLLVNVFPLALLVLLPNTFVMTIPLWITFGFAILAMSNTKRLLQVFDQYAD